MAFKRLYKIQKLGTDSDSSGLGFRVFLSLEQLSAVFSPWTLLLYEAAGVGQAHEP